MSISHTLGALAAPRRALPLAGVLVALLTAEWLASGRVDALAIDLALFAAFCLMAPAAWRSASAAVARGGSPVAGYGGFILLGAMVVACAALAPAWFGMRGTYVVDPGALGLLWVLFLVGGWGLGRDIDLEARADRLEVDAERARLMAMRAQLDPHFLFNTLNAIAEWCREDPMLAEQATLKLATMLRAILDGSTRPSWPLSREVALMAQLVELYTVRDRERYRFVLDVPEPMPDIEVPPMLFLPLVENAITHGPSAGHAGEVHVRVAVENGRVSLVISNPGAYAGRREGGQGIAMVERRLALAYAGDATLSLRASDARTITEVSMPRAPIAAEALA